MRPFPTACVLLLLVGFAGTARGADEQLRFSAQFLDGTRITGKEVQTWQETKARPTLDGKPLFDAKNPVRWLMDHRLTSETPPAFVEFFGGDRLPGRVTGFRPGNDDAYRVLPAYLLVEPQSPLYWPDGPPQREVRILAQWLRRVVWQPRGGDHYRPGTMFYRDGRALDYRSVRWTESGVRLLREQGIVEVPFAQIGELHLPRMNPWDAHFEQLAIVTPTGDERWMQWETTTGLNVTSSMERFQSKSRGGGEPQHWLHMVQPAWSLDPFWFPHRSVRVRRYFASHEVPLSSIEPVRSLERHVLGGGWVWQSDRNAQGGPLMSGGKEHAWGLGVHAYNELEFELHDSVRGFRTRLGLDQVAGAGGCAQARIFSGPATGKALFESPVIVGSAEVFDSGPLSLPASSRGKATLLLVADPAHLTRPPGADPLDIRDTLDWIEPLLELDRSQAQTEIRQRARSLIPAWRGWTVEETAGGPVALVNRWDAVRPNESRFQLEATARERFLTLSRQIQVDEKQNWLVINVSRLEQGVHPSHLQIQIDGQPLAKYDVPIRRAQGDPDPILFPLSDYRGREINVEVMQLPEGPNATVQWQALTIADQPPGLYQIFEDEALLAADLRDGDGQAALETKDRYSGSASMKVTPDARSNANLPGMTLSIRDDPRVGEFRYLRFAWKKKKGTAIVLELAHEGQWGRAGKKGTPTYRYEAGDSGTPAVKVEKQLPDEWVVVTRDLYSDFGNFTLTGLSLTCFDGDYALFDHLYLGRTIQDFERIETARVAEDARMAEVALKGKSGEDVVRVQLAIQHLRESEAFYLRRDLAESRLYAQKVVKLLPSDSPLHKQAQNMIERLDKVEKIIKKKKK